MWAMVIFSNRIRPAPATYPDTGRLVKVFVADVDRDRGVQSRDHSVKDPLFQTNFLVLKSACQ